MVNTNACTVNNALHVVSESKSSVDPLSTSFEWYFVHVDSCVGVDVDVDVDSSVYLISCGSSKLSVSVTLIAFLFYVPLFSVPPPHFPYHTITHRHSTLIGRQSKTRRNHFIARINSFTALLGLRCVVMKSTWHISVVADAFVTASRTFFTDPHVFVDGCSNVRNSNWNWLEWCTHQRIICRHCCRFTVERCSGNATFAHKSNFRFNGAVDR